MLSTYHLPPGLDAVALSSGLVGCVGRAVRDRRIPILRARCSCSCGGQVIRCACVPSWSVVLVLPGVRSAAAMRTLHAHARARTRTFLLGVLCVVVSRFISFVCLVGSTLRFQSLGRHGSTVPVGLFRFVPVPTQRWLTFILVVIFGSGTGGRRLGQAALYAFPWTQMERTVVGRQVGGRSSRSGPLPVIPARLARSPVSPVRSLLVSEPFPSVLPFSVCH
jgi:hypothetical protein